MSHLTNKQTQSEDASKEAGRLQQNLRDGVGVSSVAYWCGVHLGDVKTSHISISIAVEAKVVQSDAFAGWQCVEAARLDMYNVDHVEQCAQHSIIKRETAQLHRNVK